MREMKDSGIEWIGDIPKDWETIKVKHIAWLKGRIGWQGLTASEYSDEGPYLITGTDFLNGYINWGTCVHISEERFNEAPEIHIKEGDLLITKDGTIGKIAIAKNCPDKVSLNSGVMLIRNVGNYKYVDRYLYYVLLSDEFWDWYESSQTGHSTIRHLYQEQFCNFEFSYPPIKDQQEIADYLDNKCIEIDALTADIEQQIETLGQYKRSTITEAVTKGLDPNAKMKDSGIEWIGTIPNDWDIVKITRIADPKHPYSLGDGDHGLIKTEDYIEEGIPYIRVQNLGWCTDLQLDNVVYISEENNKKIKGSVLRPGDVLFVKTGATIGKTGIVPKEIKIANTTSHVAKLTVSEEYNPRYILYFLSSQIGYKQMWDIASQKSTRPELSIDEIKTLKIIVPSSKVEQDVIVDYLDNKCNEIDVILNEKKKELKLLAEYKKALVYEFVTGKKEVPTE